MHRAFIEKHWSISAARAGVGRPGEFPIRPYIELYSTTPSSYDGQLDLTLLPLLPHGQPGPSASARAAWWSRPAGGNAEMAMVRAALLLLGSATLGCALDNNTTRTPPMGMLNWGVFRCNVDCVTDPETCVSEKNLMGQIDAMVAGGYVKAGYVK
jgi:hypothetical protein